ncbi:Exonuclease RNase T and DNA polymerase III [Fibrisoma limi BUZ 3]|uniref:Exonuclease RNase T and DNA polymerase III n=1 Tax=Fibrisoma limi BUZ 3 TaxID=1185876 RepID=I2GKC4_9BACT|nr:3'-5' exonuclease [Fibrisoma limi]CCH54349.1 Exonuclease RNase T and DNA polymerase III [Fibrisoma limi BUZ 3]
MPFLILDLEMTGPEPDYNEIIQIGAVLFDDNWIEKGQYLTNVYPENEEAFSSHSEKIHNLSLADLQDAPMIYDVLPEMEEWVMKQLGIRKTQQTTDNEFYLRNVIICGQSVINDINFLREAYRYEKLKWPYSRTLVDLHTLSYFVFRILRRNGQPVPRGLSLRDIAGHFGLEREGDFHNALEDAILTAKCLKEVFKLGDGMTLN